MSALTDLQNVQFDVVSDGLTRDEAYALLAGVDTTTSELRLLPPPLVAAAEVHTGAMIALIPSAKDVKRLVVDGGEPADQLHLTLLYLGEAADISDRVRENIEAAVRRYTADGPITAEAFAVNMFNPGSAADKDMAVVLGVGNDGRPALQELHSNVASAVRGLGGFTLPEQHAPWVPHVTLAYTDDLDFAARVVDRVGPITFDRIRIEFGGEVEDIPLRSDPVTAAFWRSKDHPRAGDGRFIDGDGVDPTSFDGRTTGAPRTPDAVRAATPLEFGGYGRATPPRRDHVQAVDTYMSGAFKLINDGLRAGRGNPTKVIGSGSETSVLSTANVRGGIAKLDEMMAESQLTEDVVVSRGVVNPEAVFGKLWGDDVTGLSWREHGFSSTSPDRSYARSYATKAGVDGVMMNVLVPRGTGAIYVEENLGGEAGSTHHELVLDRNLRYRVVRDLGVVDGVRTLDVEVTR